MTDSFDTRTDDRNAIIRAKLREAFDGRIVRKDLTTKIKEGANVPVFVLEFLLGQHCNSEEEEIIQAGVETVKKILADNFVRPDEAQKIVFTPHTFDKKDAGAITCTPASFYCSDLSGRVPTPQPFGAGAFTTISSRTASSRFHTFIFV